VVSDIPSLRTLTSNGAIGALWSPGNARALGTALVHVTRTLSPASRAQVRAHFDACLSQRAIGEQLRAAYRAVIAAREATPMTA
jgi:hypothetical protein